ncbi:MAG: hypothetical protein LBP50_05500 [Tannerella sp.]|jgi:hypothetical protein|nr:hypothetical protein [Tannerella sp.]
MNRQIIFRTAAAAGLSASRCGRPAGMAADEILTDGRRDVEGVEQKRIP